MASSSAGPAAPDPTVRTAAVTLASLLPDLPALTDAERALMGEWLTRSITHLQDPDRRTRSAPRSSVT